MRIVLPAYPLFNNELKSIINALLKKVLIEFNRSPLTISNELKRN